MVTEFQHRPSQLVLAMFCYSFHMNLLKNIGAVLAGFLTVAILSIATDALLVFLSLFPPQTVGSPYIWWMLLIALIYRGIYTVVGGYVAARLSATKPMRQVIILGTVGTLAALAGTIANWNLGAQWYPIALVVISFPCVWFGGTLAKQRGDGING